MADFDPKHGEAIRIAPQIHRVTAPNVGPFTGAGTNTYLLGGDEVMIVDPGPDNDAHVAAVLKAVEGRTVTHLLITHTHRDHVGALTALKAATGAPSVGEGRHRDARPLHPGETNPFLYASDTDYAPDIVLADKQTLANKDVAVEAVATPGHTANHLAFAVEGQCLSGDHVMGWSTTVIAPPDGSMRAYLVSLDRLLEDEHAAYLPGHGPAIDEPRKAVTAMRSHRLMRERAILERLVAGDRTVPEIVDVLYRGIDDRLKGAAGLSVLAHLEKLAEEGLVTADTHGIDANFQPA
ncbi:MAG: MBL fold metallo-hydrolase [Devosia sp.]